jgi:hypothetical protein
LVLSRDSRHKCSAIRNDDVFRKTFPSILKGGNTAIDKETRAKDMLPFADEIFRGNRTMSYAVPPGNLPGMGHFA